MRVADEKTLDLFRTPGRCESCYKWCRKRFPHHLFCRQMGSSSRIDLPWNLIALGGSFDCQCHDEAHKNKTANQRLISIVEKREGLADGEIEQKVWDLRRKPK